jgi:D-tyrosyl-tRNA(Tyr) deacylase
MRAVVQRVGQASVTVDGETVGRIGAGLVVLVGISPTDSADDVAVLSAKLAALRIFRDEYGKMNRSVVDIAGEVLVISQFTLLADVRKGRRPSFAGAGDPELAEPLVGELADRLRNAGVPVRTGTFGAEMQVALINDGPVTIVIDVEGGKIT